MELLLDPNAWIAFGTLAALEIVLGIDNLIFISILAGRLPAHQQARARQLGIAAALISRLLLLFTLTWIMKLTAPLFTVLANQLSGKDLVLLLGGLFLIYKATMEIHHKLEGTDDGSPEVGSTTGQATLAAVVAQIMVVDVVFSLDSIITAVGMVDDIRIMVAAVITAVIFMLVFAGTIHGFVNRHPTIKMLALAFLLVIGVALIADGLEVHIPKAYIYTAMVFSVIVEALNIRLRRRGEPVRLHEPHLGPESRCAACGQALPARKA